MNVINSFDCCFTSKQQYGTMGKQIVDECICKLFYFFICEKPNFPRLMKFIRCLFTIIFDMLSKFKLIIESYPQNVLYWNRKLHSHWHRHWVVIHITSKNSDSCVIRVNLQCMLLKPSHIYRIPFMVWECSICGNSNYLGNYYQEN